MINIILILMVGAFALLLNKQIRKYFNIILIVSLVLSLVALFTDIEALSFISDGFLGLSFFVIVMFAGAFKKGSTFNKKLKSVRKEYSIVGFVLLAPHSLYYGWYYLNGTLNIEWLGVIAFVIMIPLFITSFSAIKKKMGIKNWIKLQKFSYFAYLGIYLHLMLIAPGEHKVIYTIIFGSYSVLKLVNSIREKANDKTIISAIGVLMVLLTLLVISPINMETDDEVEDQIDDVVDVIDDEDDLSDIQDQITDSGDELVDGVYMGYSKGFQNMDVSVEVTVENGVIVKIDILEYGATGPQRGMDFEEAAEDVADDIINSQSTDVDTVSGATYTTSGIIDAVEDALETT